MTKAERAIKSAKYLREYCQSIPNDCVGCAFISKDPTSVFRKGCLLNDPDHLPETWELEKVEVSDEH